MSLGSFLDPTAPPVNPADLPADYLGYLGVTDEYLVDFTASEFDTICPKDQDGAAGEDGTFAANDRFTITSASNDFIAQGIAVGDLCVIKDSKKDSARVRGLFAVKAVQQNALTLRTRGPRVGFGMPPGVVGGETSLRFRVPTARPQIAASAAKYGWQFKLTSPTNLIKPNDFVRVVAYDALFSLYFEASRQASIVAGAATGSQSIQSGNRDSLFAKAKQYEAMRDAELLILDATYKVDPGEFPIVPGKLTIRTSGGRRRRDEFGRGCR